MNSPYHKGSVMFFTPVIFYLEAYKHLCSTREDLDRAMGKDVSWNHFK